MINALGLLKQRRFLPLFTTQFLGAFNDNLFKTSMVLFATYAIFNDPKVETIFNAVAIGIAILPFFLLSALAGQLADSHDKARIIRIVKTAEIGIMLYGAAGMLIARTGYVTTGVVMMLSAVVMLGVHSTFFGPIKYAILPQHLKECDVLGGTGLVEAGTYLSILLGTIVAGATKHALVAAFLAKHYGHGPGRTGGWPGGAPVDRPMGRDFGVMGVDEDWGVRRFEEKAGEAYAQGKIGGFCHLYIGQEAVAVGALAALRADDDVLQDLVERRADVDVAVGVGRAVMQHEFGLAAAGVAQALVQAALVPGLDPARLALGQVAAHRERRVRQVEGGAVVRGGHGVRPGDEPGGQKAGMGATKSG